MDSSEIWSSERLTGKRPRRVHESAGASGNGGVFHNRERGAIERALPNEGPEDGVSVGGNDGEGSGRKCFSQVYFGAEH